MRKNGRILNKKILNALLAGAMLSSCNYNTAWANSGGTLVEWKDCYIGNSSSGSDVVIDENNSSTSIYGGTDATNAVTDNSYCSSWRSGKGYYRWDNRNFSER